MSARRPLSGTQYELAGFGYTATIASVGASLRSLAFEGRPLVRDFDADEVRPGYRGAVLAPWPNRVVDGRYLLDGVARQLALTEPERQHALHGLASWLDFTPVDVDAAGEGSSLALTARIEAQAGYPSALQLTVRYSLSTRGLTIGVEARNVGSETVPYGAGPHPYLLGGDGRVGGAVDEWVLTLPAAQVLTVDPVRLIPESVAAAESQGLDFRNPRPIGDTFIDHAFTAVDWNADGEAVATIVDRRGRGAGIGWDRRSPWVQVHTADTDVPVPRRALAIEPMTCPPDAFNSGTDLIRLAPGETSSVEWWIFAI